MANIIVICVDHGIYIIIIPIVINTIDISVGDVGMVIITKRINCQWNISVVSVVVLWKQMVVVVVVGRQMLGMILLLLKVLSVEMLFLGVL